MYAKSFNFGGADEDRTRDLLNAIQVIPRLIPNNIVYISRFCAYLLTHIRRLTDAAEQGT